MSLLLMSTGTTLTRIIEKSASFIHQIQDVPVQTRARRIHNRRFSLIMNSQSKKYFQTYTFCAHSSHTVYVICTYAAYPRWSFVEIARSPEKVCPFDVTSVTLEGPISQISDEVWVVLTVKAYIACFVHGNIDILCRRTPVETDVLNKTLSPELHVS